MPKLRTARPRSAVALAARLPRELVSFDHFCSGDGLEAGIRQWISEQRANPGLWQEVMHIVRPPLDSDGVIDGFKQWLSTPDPLGQALSDREMCARSQAQNGEPD